MKCTVCGDDVALLGNGMACNECGQPFHLRLQADDEGPECGSYVHLSELGAGCCGMLYACRLCAKRLPALTATVPPG